MTFLACDGPLECGRPIPNAPERSWHASGPIFSPNRGFWTHFGPFLMFLARLENQVWAKLGPEPPTRPADSGTFFLAPFRNYSSGRLSRHNFMHFLELRKIMSGQQGRHCFSQFLEMRRKTFRKKFRNGAQKKVPESAGLVGGSGSLVGGSGPTLAQT